MHTCSISIRSSDGPEFHCYLATPALVRRVPAVVIASSVRGVDEDLRAIADEFASHGYIVAAPDLFWRTIPGPLESGDPRAAERGQPRSQRLRVGEQDLLDVGAALQRYHLFNGRAAIVGICYGGPYALIGPKRLGYQAGIAIHGSQMLDYIDELDGAVHPIVITWGDQDHLAPPEVRHTFQNLSERMPNLEVHVLAGVQHGYMMHGASRAFVQTAYDFSLSRALALLHDLR